MTYYFSIMFGQSDEENQAVRFHTAARFQRLINKIARLSQTPSEFGTGERLPLAEIQVIHTVSNAPDITVTELSGQLGLTKGTVSPIVNRLVERGYLTKTRSKQDGRKVKLNLTDKGKTAAEGYEDYAREYVSQYASEISFGEWIIVNEILAKLEAFVDTKMKEGL
ncbi:MAG: MarR family winged helix-turn-helix transcriptional regulator [Dehalococcoidia bacterium]